MKGSSPFLLQYPSLLSSTLSVTLAMSVHIGPGIYVIFGPDNRVYVGQSLHLEQRGSINLAKRLGLKTRVYMYPDKGKIFLSGREIKFTKRLQKKGYKTVSLTWSECGKRGGSKTEQGRLKQSQVSKRNWSTPAIRKKMLKGSKKTWLTSERARKYALKRWRGT